MIRTPLKIMVNYDSLTERSILDGLILIADMSLISRHEGPLSDKITETAVSRPSTEFLCLLMVDQCAERT